MSRADDPEAEHASIFHSKAAEEIRKRDNFECAFCGFRSSKFQEVHHLDDNHKNENPENLITVCPLCHLCCHLGYAGTSGKAILITIPNCTQVELNHLVRALWVASYSKNESIRKSASATLHRLENRSIAMTAAYGYCDSTVLGAKLASLPPKIYKERKNILKDILLLPRSEPFIEQIKHWKNEEFSDDKFGDWTEYSDMIRKKVTIKV